MDAAAGQRCLRSLARLIWLRRDVLALLAVAVVARSAGLLRPLVGNFATKNVVYAMIARNWARGHAPWWRPTLDQLAGGEMSLHLTELPLPAYLTGALWRTLGGTLDVWGRAVSVAWSAAAVLMLYALLQRHVGRGAAWVAALTLAVSPVSIVYGQSFMLEPAVLALSVAVLWTLDRWQFSRRPAWLTAATFAWALVLLIKPFMVVLALPAAMLLVASPNCKVRQRDWKWPLVAAVAGTLPCLAWLWHVAHLTAADNPWSAHLFYSLRQSAAAHAWPSPLWLSVDLYRGIGRDLSTVVLTPVGLVLAVWGLRSRRPLWLTAWLIASALLVVALPRKFHEMNYYFVLVLPPIGALSGLGWERLRAQAWYRRKVGVVLAASALLASARCAWRPGFVTPAEDRAVVAAAHALQTHSTPGERIVAMHGTTLDLLYHCDRQGWAVAPHDPYLDERLNECRRQRAQRLVVVGDLAERRRLEDLLGAGPIASGDGFAVFMMNRAGGTSSPVLLGN